MSMRLTLSRFTRPPGPGSRSALARRIGNSPFGGPSHGGARRAVAAVDYLFLMVIAFPCSVVVFWAAPRIMKIVQEMTSVLVSWPFL